MKHLHTFSESKEFNIFIFTTIVIAGISVGIQTNRSLQDNVGKFFILFIKLSFETNADPGFLAVLVVLDYLILMVFLFEAIIKITAQMPKPVSCNSHIPDPSSHLTPYMLPFLLVPLFSRLVERV